MEAPVYTSSAADHIRQKLRALDKEEDLADMLYKGKLSFGISAADYSHLSGWATLLQQKKRFVKTFWLDAFVLTLLVTYFAGHYFDGAPATWWNDILRLVLTSAAITVFPVSFIFFNLFASFRRTEREVRRIIYEDVLFQLAKEERKELAA